MWICIELDKNEKFEILGSDSLILKVTAASETKNHSCWYLETPPQGLFIGTVRVKSAALELRRNQHRYGLSVEIEEGGEVFSTNLAVLTAGLIDEDLIPTPNLFNDDRDLSKKTLNR